MALSLKQEYEKKYRETVELLKLLGRVAGVQCDLQLTAFRDTCKLAVAYGKLNCFSPPESTTQKPDLESLAK